VDQPPHLGGHVIRIGPRRLVAAAPPGRVGLDGLAPHEYERLGRRLVPEGLPEQMRGDAEDYEAAVTGQRNPLRGGGLHAGGGVAIGEVELPGRLLPAVEAGIGDEIEPFRFGDVAKLSANEADQMVGATGFHESDVLSTLSRPQPPFCSESDARW
jgi:hypothetical protein